jgi:alanine dehydrogenase
MDIGIPRETFRGENRVALSPPAVKTLVQHGHKVYVEEGAGLPSNYLDADYARAGATIVYSPEESFGRGQVIVKVQRPTPKEDDLLRDGQILFSFLHPAAARKDQVRTLLEKHVTAIGYEIIEEDSGALPLVRTFSEIAGQMCLPIAARCLETKCGGRGILLGGAPGVPPAEIVIIGAGNVGRSAARTAQGLGASVTLLDIDVNQLRRALRRLNAGAVTATATPQHIEKALSYADVLIMAVMVRGGRRAPMVVTRDMVRQMKKGAVLIDTAIDQGGSVETSRPTTLDSPTYIEEGVVHFCVPNMSSAVPRTASRVLSNAALPYILDIADECIEDAMRNHRPLARGVFLYNGHCCNKEIAHLFGLTYKPLQELIEGVRL